MKKTPWLAVTAAGLFMCSAVAMAQQAPSNSAPAASQAAAAAPADDPDEIVCHAGVAPTGTRLAGPRVCHTRREWDDIRKQSQDSVMLMQNLGRTGGTPGN